MSQSIFLFHGFIKSIPFELEEAAKIDGCAPAQTFYRIIFPLLRPIHATVLVLNGIWIWNDYLLPLLILGKGNNVMTIPLAVSNFAGAYAEAMGPDSHCHPHGDGPPFTFLFRHRGSSSRE